MQKFTTSQIPNTTSEQLDSIVERMIELNSNQLTKISQFLDEIDRIHDFSLPVLTEQEKQSLAKMFDV